MKPTSYVEALRGIRDDVNREMSSMSYDEWERKAKQEVSRFPKLKTIMDRATKPASPRTIPSHPAK